MWARLKNRLVVFCENEKMKIELLNIRRSFNVFDRTEIVIIENIFSVERDLYSEMIKISKDSYFLKFRKMKKTLENRANYDYIMLMKSYCVYRACVTFDINTEYIAWIDFGFNKGGWVYTNAEDFSFMLSCDKSPGKITLFHLPNKLDKRPLFDIIRTVHPDGMTGGFFICPKTLTKFLWETLKDCMSNLVSLGLIDDDQPLLLFASRIHPDLFELKSSYYFWPLKEHCNGKHLRTLPSLSYQGSWQKKRNKRKINQKRKKQEH